MDTSINKPKQDISDIREISVISALGINPIMAGGRVNEKA